MSIVFSYTPTAKYIHNTYNTLNNNNKKKKNKNKKSIIFYNNTLHYNTFTLVRSTFLLIDLTLDYIYCYLIKPKSNIIILAIF